MSYVAQKPMKIKTMSKTIKLSVALLFAVVFSGCKSYTSNVLLTAKTEEINWQSTYQKTIVETPIKVGDKIQFSIFTNMGEAIIDPSGNLQKTTSFGDANTTSAEKPAYEVLESGVCFFPVIGKMQVVGLKVSELDSALSARYETFYNDVYVISKVINKKIIMLVGGTGKVIPYTTNMNLLEAIALYGGMDNNSKGYNIKIVRGDLKNPEFTIVNLRTMSDMRSSIVNLRPDDIIYVEPVRRPVAESVRDNLYIVNIVQVFLTLTILVNSLTR
jgi:polysaccharide biosynthesis/export protein